VEQVSFQVVQDAGGPRVGRLATPHGTIETPAFLPLATFGTVRGLLPEELRGVGVQAILANAYHLHLRPGEEVVARLGGLHRFAGWFGPILTDSGGYQAYSLRSHCERTEEGLSFRRSSGAARILLSPERSVAIQETLGADLVVSLDEFEPIASGGDEAARDRVRAQMERTLRWAERCRSVHRRPDQLLFGVIQGGAFPDLRRESARCTAALGFRAFAIGGLGLGEAHRLRNELVRLVIDVLPRATPRYLMGVGMPQELIEAVALGADLFDSVMPTRHGRRGWVFTRHGRFNLRHARFVEDRAPLAEGCPCVACTRCSRAYVRHLVVTGDPLGGRLLSLHNLAFYMRLVAEMRAAIEAGRFEAWRDGGP
jgi:queuine tRNA-ribosyltransferase